MRGSGYGVFSEDELGQVGLSIEAMMDIVKEGSTKSSCTLKSAFNIVKRICSEVDIEELLHVGTSLSRIYRVSTW
jgi:hypothetical protein